MKKWFLKLALKFVSYDTLVSTIAQALAYIIDYARKNSSEEGWEKAKATIKAIKNWITLFDEVYEDDTLTPEEDKRIQDAIAECTTTESIYDLIQGKKGAAKESKAKKSKKKTK